MKKRGCVFEGGGGWYPKAPPPPPGPIPQGILWNHSKRDNKRSFNVSSHKHDVTKPLNVREILMTSIYFYELVLVFFTFHHNFCYGNVDNFFKGYVTRKNFSNYNFLNHDFTLSLFITTSTVSIFSIYHTQMFYLVQIVFILLVSIFVNILFLYKVFLMIYFM